MESQFHSFSEDVPAVPVSYSVAPKILSNLHAVFLRVTQLKPEAQMGNISPKMYKNFDSFLWQNVLGGTFVFTYLLL